MMTTPTRLTLEKWALGKLPSAEVAELERACAADAELAAWASRVRADVARAAVDLPQLQLPAHLGDDRSPLAWLRMLSLAGAAAAAVLVFTVLIPDPVPVAGPGTAPPTWRGSLDVAVHLVHDGSAAEQGAVVTARAGDRLQYSVAAPEAGYLMVYDVQANRQVQQWLAPRPVAARASETGAVLVDDYAGGERVYFVFHSEPIETARIADAVERAYETPIADLDALPGLPKGAVQRSILLLRATD